MLKLNEDDEKIDAEHDIFSTEDEDGIFFDFLYSCVGIIAVIIVVGIAFEILRKKCKRLRREKQVGDAASSYANGSS